MDNIFDIRQHESHGYHAKGLFALKIDLSILNISFKNFQILLYKSMQII